MLEQLLRTTRQWPCRNCLMLLACCGLRGRAERPNHATNHDIELQHVDLARALVDRGADQKVRDRAWTPLAYAAEGFGDGCVDMVALLLDTGGAVNTSLTLKLHFVQFVVSRPRTRRPS